MSSRYLTSSFRDKDRVKALGARWDPAQRQWYVPEGLALTPFAEWLPAGGTAPPSPSTALISPELEQGGSRSLSAAPRGIPCPNCLAAWLRPFPRPSVPASGPWSRWWTPVCAMAMCTWRSRSGMRTASWWPRPVQLSGPARPAASFPSSRKPQAPRSVLASSCWCSPSRCSRPSSASRWKSKPLIPTTPRGTGRAQAGDPRAPAERGSLRSQLLCTTHVCGR